MKKILLYVCVLLPAFLLINCTTTPAYFTETITKMRIGKESIVMETNEISYEFIGKGTSQEIKRFRAFYQSYQSAIVGTAVLLQKKFGKVDATYTVLINKEKIDKKTISTLYDEYNPLPHKENNMLAIHFKASGHYINIIHSKHYDGLGDKYLVKQPFEVSVIDNSTSLTPVGELLFVPFLPFFMIVGCATGPCV